MKKRFQVLLSMMLIVTLLVPSTSAFATTKVTDEAVSIQQISILKNNIASIENDLKTENTDVSTELNKQVSNYQEILKSTKDSDERSKADRLIITTKSLLRDYQLYKQPQANQITLRSGGNLVYSAAVATVIAYFQIHSYDLSAELLTHARDNTSRNSVYDPTYGFRCALSPVVTGIWKSSRFSGSSSFPKNAFASDQLNDLYYAIHAFDFTKHLAIGNGNSYLEITDTYDYAHQSEYTGVAGIAVETMYQAQQAGVIVPYKVKIDLYR